MTQITIPLPWFTVRVEVLRSRRRAPPAPGTPRLHARSLGETLSPHLLRDLGLHEPPPHRRRPGEDPPDA